MLSCFIVLHRTLTAPYAPAIASTPVIQSLTATRLIARAGCAAQLARAAERSLEHALHIRSLALEGPLRGIGARVDGPRGMFGGLDYEPQRRSRGHGPRGHWRGDGLERRRHRRRGRRAGRGRRPRGFWTSRRRHHGHGARGVLASGIGVRSDAHVFGLEPLHVRQRHARRRRRVRPRRGSQHSWLGLRAELSLLVSNRGGLYGPNGSVQRAVGVRHRDASMRSGRHARRWRELRRGHGV